jgi:MFS transporter, OFA family, oxalate/formate antiporter
MGSGRETPRALAGAVLVDLAVSPMFAWDIFAGAFAHRLRADASSLTLVFSAGLACFTVGVLGGGRAADRVSPRRLAVLTAVGVVAGLVGAGMAFSVSVLVAAFGVVLGAATGLGYATAVHVAGTLAGRRGSALALVVSAYAAGTILIVPVAVALLNATTLLTTFAVLAATLGVAVLAGAALLPAAAPPRAAGKGPDTAGARRRTPPIRGSVAGLWLVFGLGSAPALTAFAHAGQAAGNPDAAVLAVPVLSAGNLVGRLVAGPASDRVGRPVALHVAAAALAAACAVLAICDRPGVRLAALLLLGAQYGALSALVPAATADAVPAQRFGAAYGVVFTGWGLAGLVAPVAATALAARTGWERVFLVFVGVAVLAWLTLAATPRARTPPQ